MITSANPRVACRGLLDTDLMTAVIAPHQTAMRARTSLLFDPSTIVGVFPVTAWREMFHTSGDFDLDTVVGTGANLIILESGVALHTGVVGDNFSTPSAPANRITSDITLEWVGYLDDWTLFQDVIAKRTNIGDKRSYILRQQSNGIPQLILSTDGINEVAATASEVLGFSDGALGGWRTKWDQSESEVTFEKTLNGGATWAAFGTNPQTLTLASINDNDQILEIGSSNTGTAGVVKGKTVRARIYNDATATNVVVDFDPSKATVNSDTFTSGGVVWTANGDSFVNATGHAGLYSRGSVGLETSVGQLINNPVTVIAVFKPTLASPSFRQKLFDARSDAGKRMVIQTIDANSNRYHLFQGAFDLDLAQTYDTKLRILTGLFLGTASSKLTVSDKGSVTGNAGSHNWDFGSIFMNTAGGHTMQGLFLEYQVHPREMRDREIVRLQDAAAEDYLA